ncbi:MAG TPA: hypothetical protein PKL78_08375 [Anaerolineales bacterium]|nr:hypothetical protein [Anaerolineales bacterium]
MNILALKLILAPIIIGSASLAGRRWGPAISGWIVGLPLTSGPVIFFLAISHDIPFAANAIRGTLSGGFSLIAFCLVHAWLATKFDWGITTLGSLTVFAILTTTLQDLTLPLPLLFILVLFTILAGALLMPKQKSDKVSASTLSRWDIPARILVGTSFILFVTGIAPIIGPKLTGLLTTFPLFASILAIFSQRQQGADGAIHVLRGLVYGLFAFAGFYLVLGLLIERIGLGGAFGLAILSALLIQGTSLIILRKLHLQ